MPHDGIKRISYRRRTRKVLMITILVTIIIALAVVALAAIGDRKRRQQIADKHWRDVEGQ
jgi:hypothetical protein